MAKGRIFIDSDSCRKGQIRLFIDDISYYREWEEEGGKDKSVIYTKAGKQIVCNHTAKELDELINNA